MMIYRSRVPQPPLDSFVESVWVYEGNPRPHALERILPTARAQLIVNLKEDETWQYDAEQGYKCVTGNGTVIAGAGSRHHVIDTSEQEYVAGVDFRPGGTVPFLRAPAHEFRDTNVPLDALWDAARAHALRERLLECNSADGKLDVLEQALVAAWTPRLVHPAVAYALTVFARVPSVVSVSAVSRAIGMSAKRFIERFKADVGLSPKLYCRVRRFQNAVTRAHGGERIDWVQVALDCGCYDQAHFAHDFRAFAGLAPTSYRAARTPFQNHVKFLQADRDGI